MKKILVILIVSFMISFKHPFYMSVTDLKYNAKEKALQGSVKMFTNDLENALRRLTAEKVDLIHPRDTVKTTRLLKDYLKKRLSFTVNNELKDLQLIGFEHEQESVWLYIELKKCQAPKKVDIVNSLLYDFLKEQINIVHLDVNGNKQSSKVLNPEKNIHLSF